MPRSKVRAILDEVDGDLVWEVRGGNGNATNVTTLGHAMELAVEWSTEEEE